MPTPSSLVAGLRLALRSKSFLMAHRGQLLHRHGCELLKRCRVHQYSGAEKLLRCHYSSIDSRDVKKNCVHMTFVGEDGDETNVKAEVGKSLLEVAHENDVELEGACGGDLACSTCHVILPEEYYKCLPEKQEEEEDMLDLAWGLTETSRLGCQIIVGPHLSGMRVTLPEEDR